jgi:hypothetical protein
MLIQIRYVETQDELGCFFINYEEVLRFVEVSVMDFTADAFRYMIAGTNELKTILNSNLIDIHLCPDSDENGFYDTDLIRSTNKLRKSIQKVA